VIRPMVVLPAIEGCATITISAVGIRQFINA
jgi:hypothetical protein